jgi:hypothetical protein
MATTLNFPTNPTLNQLYTFGGKTWIWTGQAWRLNPQGAINGIVIGNTTPAAGSFTTFSAGNVTAGNAVFSGNVTSANITTGNATISGNLAIAGVIKSSLDIYGDVVANDIDARGEIYAPGNITTSGYFVGNGRAITGIVASGGASIDLGNANVKVNTGGNVTVSPNGVANAATFTASGLAVVGNVTANIITANTFVGNISGNISIAGANTGVVFNDSGVATASAGFTFNKTANSVTVVGNVTANTFVGSGSGLTDAMVNRGGDTSNWNVLLQMGTYLVNRTNWGGVTGAPNDSQVYVGLLEVKTSVLSNGTTAIEQTFYPGTVTLGDVKIEFNRSYWNNQWTGWIQMTNNDQRIDGGEFI